MLVNTKSKDSVGVLILDAEPNDHLPALSWNHTKLQTHLQAKVS